MDKVVPFDALPTDDGENVIAPANHRLFGKLTGAPDREDRGRDTELSGNAGRAERRTSSAPLMIESVRWLRCIPVASPAQSGANGASSSGRRRVIGLGVAGVIDRRGLPPGSRPPIASPDDPAVPEPRSQPGRADAVGRARHGGSRSGRRARRVRRE